MQNELKDKFPGWVNDNEYGKYDLCLSNDIDSLLSCLYLEQLKGYKINYFYDFNSIYKANQTGKEAIGIDVALERGKVWDNHVTRISSTDNVNPDSANVNALTGISRDNYYTKYCGSTLLQILSYYNIPLPKSREGRLIILAIDSTFLGYYSRDFKAINQKWLKKLELFDLLDVLESEKTANEFLRVKKQYNLDSQIKAIEGKLHTNIDLAAMQGFFDFPLYLPADQFHMTHTFKRTSQFQLDRNKEYSKHDINGLFSIALTHKNKGKYTAGCKAV